MSWYDFCDFFTTSYAEGKRNQFSKLCSKLGRSISKIEEELSVLSDAIEEIHQTLTVNQGIAAEGEIETTFVTAEQKFYADCKEIYDNMNHALSNLKQRKADAASELAYWEEECRREDEEERERQREE